MSKLDHRFYRILLKLIASQAYLSGAIEELAGDNDKVISLLKDSNDQSAAAAQFLEELLDER